tara:strand:+ start:122 stop:955 length:834 start_codon:yes stop_codon:yes gene_type:complete
MQVLYFGLVFFFVNIFLYISDMDFKSIKGKPHYLFDDLLEYKAFGNDEEVISSWRKGREGDWVYTDDGFICQILKKSSVNHPGYKTPRTMIRTVCGSFICEQKSHTILGDNGIVENIYTFSGNSKAVKSYVKDRKMNNREFLFARYVVSGSKPTSAYKKAYPEAKNENYIKRKSKILLQKKEIRTMVDEEIQSILNGEGVTPEWIIAKYKDIIDLSESDSNKLRSLESLTKIAGLFDTDKKQEQLTVFQGFTPKQLEALQGGKETNILAHAEKEEEE